MAYLNSNSPLFSITKERDFLEFRMIEPKLMSFTGEILKLLEEKQLKLSHTELIYYDS